MSCWNKINRVCNREFASLSKKLHQFFWTRNFREAYYQNHLDVLTACENPGSIGQFKHFDEMFPLRQTNQMGLEYAILEDPTADYYCFTTSYRMEQEPKPGRHNTIFPMVEFEIRDGTMDGLINFEKDLIRSLGYEGEFAEIDYKAALELYGVDEIDDKEEDDMTKTLAPVVFLKNFPENTDPFFNMQRDPIDSNISMKVDVLMLGRNTLGEVRGMETIGSAVRSTDVNQMKHYFNTSVNGEYAKTLYNRFGQDRVDKELNTYFNMTMFPRAGAGIGFTRMLNFCRHHNLL